MQSVKIFFVKGAIRILFKVFSITKLSGKANVI